MTSLQQMLLHQEGKRNKPYVDCCGKSWRDCRCIEKGQLTIGIGRNLDDKGLSDDEIYYNLNNDTADAIEDVRHNFSCYDTLSEARRMVLVSLAFNLGRERLAKFVRFIGAVHLGKYGEAADELLNSKAAQQAPARYQVLARMMRNDSTEWA